MNQREAMERFEVKSTATWAKLVKQGLPRTPRGRGYTYDEDTLAAWFAELRGDDGDDLDDADYAELWKKARAKKTDAEAKLREIKLAEERGELVRADEVSATWSRALVRLRSRLLRLPSQSAAPLFAAASELEVEEILRDSVRTALEELASETETDETKRKTS